MIIIMILYIIYIYTNSISLSVSSSRLLLLAVQYNCNTKGLRVHIPELRGKKSLPTIFSNTDDLLMISLYYKILIFINSLSINKFIQYIYQL